MTTTINKFNSHAIVKNRKRRNENSPGASNGNVITFSAMLKGLFVVLLSAVYMNVNAQIAPSANIRGPLKAYTSDTAIVITSQIAASEDPIISYSLTNNISGATILSQGPILYNNSTGIFTQTVVIKPGSIEGAFNIKLTATTPGGSTEASAGVTVVK